MIMQPRACAHIWPSSGGGFVALLSRIFGVDKEKVKELEKRISDLEENIRRSSEQQEDIKREVMRLQGQLGRVGAADAKLVRGLVELVRTLEREQKERPSASSSEAHRSSSEELESEILRILDTEGPSTARAIAAKLGKTREHLSRALKSMVARGKITRQGGGKAFVYSVVEQP